MMTESNSMYCEVLALKECQDLRNNGYIVKVQSRLPDGCFIKLRHRSNGRTLVVRSYPDYYEVREGSSILKKHCPYAELISD